jgi:ribose transport system permease protein
MSAISQNNGRLGRYLAFRRIGAVYVLVLIIVLFGVLRPDTFLTSQSVKTILNQYSVSGMLALSLVIPLACGIFDLSVGAQASMASVTVAVLVTQHHVPIYLAIIITLVVGLVMGLVNALVVVVWRIDSFIGTLGTGAILDAVAVGVSGNKTISGPTLSGPFQHNVALRNLDGITIPVLYLLIIVLAVAFVLERTKTGRHWYAIGFDVDAARLAGVRTRALQVGALLATSTIATVAGITLTARVSSGTPGAGDPYLLSAFAGAFLGATQFRNGRFNPWGTVLAILLIGTGEYGLSLSNAPQWAPNVFDGVVLIAAIGLTNLETGRLPLPPWLRSGRVRKDGSSPPDRPVSKPATPPPVESLTNSSTAIASKETT